MIETFRFKISGKEEHIIIIGIYNFDYGILYSLFTDKIEYVSLNNIDSFKDKFDYDLIKFEDESKYKNYLKRVFVSNELMKKEFRKGYKLLYEDINKHIFDNYNILSICFRP